MEITESQIYEGFGLEQPQQEQPEQESTMPAAGVEQPTQERGAPAQEEVQQVETSPTGETEREPEQTEHQVEDSQGEMSLEQRRENAPADAGPRPRLPSMRRWRKSGARTSRRWRNSSNRPGSKTR